MRSFALPQAFPALGGAGAAGGGRGQRALSCDGAQDGRVPLVRRRGIGSCLLPAAGSGALWAPAAGPGLLSCSVTLAAGGAKAGAATDAPEGKVRGLSARGARGSSAGRE